MRTHPFPRIFLIAGAVGLATVPFQMRLHAQEALQDVVTVIMEGKVVMPDGTPPPKSVGIERVCSDVNGSAPGPITDKKGHYSWSQKLNPAVQRACYMRATLDGFTSTVFDLGDLKLADYTAGTNRVQLPDFVLSPRDSGAANTIALVSLNEVPGKAREAYKLASKALDADNVDEGIRQLKIAVAAVPKFADGWNNLGSAYERQRMLTDAKDALQHAIEANPKAPAPYLRLARVANRLGDWDLAAKSEGSLLAIEKRFYPEVYLQQAITRFGMKDLAGAEESIKTLQSMDLAHKQVRSEYILGRIELAKGDVPGAKEHIANYVKLDPTSPDIQKIEAQLSILGTSAAAPTDVPLERP